MEKKLSLYDKVLIKIAILIENLLIKRRISKYDIVRLVAEKNFAKFKTTMNSVR